jgi:glucose/arabinose dehydrogenase
MKKLALLLLLTPWFSHSQAVAPGEGSTLYAQWCATCHSGDVAAAFRSASVLKEAGDEPVARVIRDGRPERGMPSFGRTLSENDIRALVSLLRGAASSVTTGSMIGKTIEAESLRADRSAGYAIAEEGSIRFVQYVDRGSHLCYDNIDLTGVKSIEYRYAKGEGEPPRRFALLAYGGHEFDSRARVHLGEKVTDLTGGWLTFRSERIGLLQELQGIHRLCFMGMGGGGVFNLDSFTLRDVPAANDGVTQHFELPLEPVAAGGHEFRLEKVAEIDGEIWSLAFLDQGTILATQKSGVLWMFRAGERIGPITGTPAVEFSGQGGLFAVQAHPAYRKNSWVYLTYAEPGPQGSMTSIVRGRLRGTHWVDEQVIYRAGSQFFRNSQAHYGGRLVFDGPYLFFSVGERGQQDNAQDLTNPLGKIHRIFDDGRVPGDNPFVGSASAIASIWSYGHRNPQGLTINPRTHEVWETEHGPKGGDELNRIVKGANYGWPLVTFGTNYDGTVISTETTRAGFVSPSAHWIPSPGVSGLHFYTATEFPKWRNHLLVANLAQQKLCLVRLHGNEVIGQEVLIQGIGRIRDVTVGPDGYPYIALNQPNGMIYRMVPVRRR